ncbi:hypothetical protein F5146DRAFT_1017467 [Armillaria mellea]|nr:hypothetical protein F5146DRAFT_1017467 [Armillaria mellea]
MTSSAQSRRHTRKQRNSNELITQKLRAPSDIDEPWPYMFQAGDRVWIRTAGGIWHPGKVCGQTRKGQTREKEGLFYPVVFNEKLRKYFAPLNGEIKPNTRHIRGLLAEAGWL